ncbi:Uma2 family endonuclease [Microcoleus sp. PH2017_28_MFU_U_A]|uniref:Uma2 family endonuclease n=1 Tax=Microcoleus sp. PH2017_28_MFU_U_A TaxID=2798838 RepID=UPI001DFA5D35|nr:Uma2 family endonuclease [Microcoleus sp. PH2017_28_MFU_U_A]MCC3592663.1 Uma2 family endonuclease [Microcoleus sp. PH2017_28_MFU_U_A]
MIQAHKQKLTFEEYLTYEDDTDNRYELIDGELVTLPPESEPNNAIVSYLFLVLVNSGIPWRCIKTHMCEIQVPILREGDAANRYPDLVVLRPEHILLTATRLTITQTMPPPQLVVEVVSPGRVGRDRDYISKRAQYAARGIPEYWIVDPQEEIVAVLRLESGEYVEVGVFQGEQALISPAFPQLNLTAGQVLGGEF